MKAFLKIIKKLHLIYPGYPKNLGLKLAEIFSELTKGVTDLDINLDKLRNCLCKQCAVSLYWGACDRVFELVPIYRDASKCW